MKSQWIQIASLFLAAACLAGCVSTNPAAPTNPPQTQSVTAAAPDAPSTSAQIPTETVAIVEPTHVEKVVDENFSVDADIVGAPENGMAGVYTAAPKVFTKEEMEAFVNHCGFTITSTKEWEERDMLCYTGTCSGNFGLSYMRGLPGVNQHPYATFQFYSMDERLQIYGEYPIYTTEYFYQTNPEYTIGWMFTEPKDFSFATKAEAETVVRDALKVLGLPDLTLLRTLYIDHSIMEEAGKRVTTDEAFAPIIGAKENNGYSLRSDWSEKDDAYLFSFGIPVSNTHLSYSLEAGDTTNYCGTDIVALYTTHGISRVFVDTPWVVGEAVEEPAPIVSAQAALEVAKEKYTNDQYAHMTNKRIEEICFEYQYFQNGDTWLLKPVWSVKLSFSIRSVNEKFFEYTDVDALTGKEL